jgi:hypothetical protein
MNVFIVSARKYNEQMFIIKQEVIFLTLKTDMP